MDRGLNGNSSLAYQGVRPVTPPNLVMHPRAPLTTDYKEFCVGDIWIDNSGRKLTPPVYPGPGDVYMLTSVARNEAVWVPIVGGITTITGTDGIHVHGTVAGNINLTSDTGALTITNTAPNTLSIDLAGGGEAIDTFILDQGANVSPNAAGEVTLRGVAGRTVTIGDGPTHTVTVDIGPTVPTTFTTETNNAIAAANVLSIVGNDNIDVTGNGNVITISAANIGGASQFDTDQGSAFPVDGVLRIVGGPGMRTTANGNTITILTGISPTLLNTTVYNVPGTYNWNRFAGATRAVVYLYQGGGGGGKGLDSGVDNYSGGGGGGGSGSRNIVNIAAPANAVVVVGNGGAPASAVIAGDGEISSFDVYTSGLAVNHGGNGLSDGLVGSAPGAGGIGFEGGNGGKGGYGWHQPGMGDINTPPVDGNNNYSNNPTGGGGAAGYYKPLAGNTIMAGAAGGDNSKLSGGNGGTIVPMDGTGKDGANGFTGGDYTICGTGGGGGAAYYEAGIGTFVFGGGNGGLPSGGGGGSSSRDFATKPAGRGGHGAVVVLEYDF